MTTAAVTVLRTVIGKYTALQRLTWYGSSGSLQGSPTKAEREKVFVAVEKHPFKREVA